VDVSRFLIGFIPAGEPIYKEGNVGGEPCREQNWHAMPTWIVVNFNPDGEYPNSIIKNSYMPKKKLISIDTLVLLQYLQMNQK
jgi:hypothetical protein